MAYNASSTYATVEQLEAFVTAGGWLHIADRDGDGTVSTAELDAMKDVVEASNNIIDAALEPHMSPDAVRAADNDWLRDRCLEIAAYKGAVLGGRDAAPSVADNYDDALRMLNQVNRGEFRVPRLTYPKTETNRTTRTPRAINPGRRRR